MSAWEETAASWWRWMHERYMRHDVKWKGIPCIQNPLDLWMLHELAWEARVETVIELGTARGGTATFLAESLPAYGHVVTIDRAPCAIYHSRVKSWCMDAYTEEAIARIKREYTVRMMVIDDASHEPGDVARGLELYSPLVAVNSFYVVMDTIIDTGILEYPTPEPKLSEVIERFLSSHPGWKREEGPYGISNCIGGILRRTA